MSVFESKKIKSDVNRFKKIVRGQIKRDLKKYIKSQDMLGKQGNEYVSIPISRINLPHFEHDFEKKGGVGQGEDQEANGKGQPEAADKGKAGSAKGHHVMEVDVPLEELAKIMGEELELPRIEPKGEKQHIEEKKEKYTGIRSVGPNSLRHFQRTFKQALIRNIINGNYDPIDPMIIPIKDDIRYRSSNTIYEKKASAAIIYIMDVSGSMGADQKEIVRTESFWIDTWLRSQYKEIASRYIIHDAQAKEVDQDTFYKTRESGGTIISSAYQLCKQIIDEAYVPNQWNIYIFHFSDGDNWSSEDTLKCMDIIERGFLPHVNMFCYGQVESQYGSGQFLKDLQSKIQSDQVITSKIDTKDDIYDSIKTFLGKGK